MIFKHKGCNSANDISITFSSSNVSGFTYDSENGYYNRTVNSKPNTDYTIKETNRPKNIITYQVKKRSLTDLGK